MIGSDPPPRQVRSALRYAKAPSCRSSQGRSGFLKRLIVPPRPIASEPPAILTDRGQRPAPFGYVALLGSYAACKLNGFVTKQEAPKGLQ
jgi:hypothetical protein